MKRVVSRLVPVFSLLLFGAALWVLHRELAEFRYQDVVGFLRSLPATRVAAATAFAVAGYLVLTGYDALGFRHIRHPLPYRRIALASFVGYAFSNSIGLSVVTGMPLRFRLYSTWGVTAEDVARVVTFCFLTFWVGFFTLSGAVFTLLPADLPASSPLHLSSDRPLGVLCLAVVVAYLGTVALRRRPLSLRGWEFPLPAPRIALGQIVLSSLDWALAAAVLYSLLPPAAHLSYVRFLGLFLLAQLLGLLSQIPGGLGVFDTVIVVLLAPVLPASAILGSVVAYRLIYYVLPLTLATLLLAAHEAALRRHHVERAARFLGRWAPTVVPQVLAFTTFVGGVILLFSGATPPIRSRLAWLNDLLPLPIIEASHFLGSLAGVGLLILARGLQRRLDAAYHLTALLLGVGIAVSLLKGLDYEEAIALTLMLAALVPCRGHFYRKASLISERFSTGWSAAIALVLLATAWLALFSFKHVEFSSELWWHFALSGNAPRALRALVGAITGALAFSAFHLLGTTQPEPEPPTAADLERAAEIATASARTYAYLALVGDKTLLFNEARSAYLMYAVEGRSWVSMGHPVGPEEEAAELSWRFQELADRHDGWPVFYQVPEDQLFRYVDLGLALLKLGEEARVPLEGFSLEGRERKELRHIQRKAEREGCSFEVHPATDVPPLLGHLERISDAWLEVKNTREKSFSLGSFRPDYLRRFPVALVRQEGRIVAFANLWPGAGREELSVDLMRHTADPPPGVMDYLFVSTMLWGSAEGFRWFNLGMAPLSGLEGFGAATFWNRLGSLIFRHGEHFYNFQGLRRYKEKFGPRWEPRYLAAPGGLALPQVLANVTTLIAGGVRGVFVR